MDSEDDANDAESMDADYCSGDTAVEYSDDDDGGDEDYEFENDLVDSDDVRASHRQQKSYIALQEAEVRQRQENDITTVSTVLSISRVAASILLCHYHWRVNSVHEAWFANEDRVRKAVGLLEGPNQFPEANEVTCGICFESTALEQISYATCGHPFCDLCWRGYMSTSIYKGPGCLMMRCPNPSCGAAIGQDMINLLVSDEDREKYARFLYRSYIENNRKIKWCPAPSCEFAVEFVGSGNYDVSCLCSHRFCWNCTEEAHYPVDCGAVAKWFMNKNNNGDSENRNWILAHSKPCPKCKKSIEKSDGCLHMTCTAPCKFEFCWLCLGSWTDHGDTRGGFYACNRYEAARKEGEFDETETKREMAKKNSLDGYSHYYDRWAAIQSSRQKSLADLHQMQTVHLEKLSDKQSQPESQLQFITEAWLQIVECMRVLKLTYAYGYFLPEREYAKRLFFEYLQGEAEAGLERLHQCAEEDLQAYLGPESPPTDFNDFRTKLADLTSVTRNYFENLVRALENGLSEVDSKWGSSKTSTSKSGVATGKGKSRRGKASSRTGGSSNTSDDQGTWTCDQCTFFNIRSLHTCGICQQPRRNA